MSERVNTSMLLDAEDIQRFRGIKRKMAIIEGRLIGRESKGPRYEDAFRKACAVYEAFIAEHWSAEDEAALAAVPEAGESRGERDARLIGESRGRGFGVLPHDGRPVPEDVLSEVARLTGEGASHLAVAGLLGVKRQRVGQLLERKALLDAEPPGEGKRLRAARGRAAGDGAVRHATPKVPMPGFGS